ncbi:hypothetical protein LBMAG53_36700 [Planctomycetota bacterium]|nr:hypothetical protein LBMAG53_36700 [Planctomycetota bacterium]
MRLLLAVLAVTAWTSAAWVQAAEGQVYLAGGATYFNPEIRNMTDDFGIYVALGYIDGVNSGAVGKASADIDWRVTLGKGNRLDSFGATYTERAMLSQEGFYGGFGIGSWYHKLKDQRRDENGSVWRPGGKLLVGMDLRKDFFIEVAYCYTGKIRGVNTSGFTGALGIHF